MMGRLDLVGLGLDPAPTIARIACALNDLREQGLVGDFAIAGAFAFIYHSEPFETKDFDMMVVLPESPSGLIDLGPIWTYFTEHGAIAEGQFLRVGPVKLDIVPPTDALDEEAVAQAEKITIDGEPVKVLTAEHAIAIAVRTGRARDRRKIATLLETPRTPINFARLDEILSRYKLLAKWHKIREQA